MSDKTIDVHGLTVDMAKREIERTIAACDSTVKRVIVIHGYHRGDAIREFIQRPNSIRSKKIKQKRFTKNQGETIFELY
jgi:hypothetical protein